MGAAFALQALSHSKDDCGITPVVAVAVFLTQIGVLVSQTPVDALPRLAQRHRPVNVLVSQCVADFVVIHLSDEETQAPVARKRQAVARVEI